MESFSLNVPESEFRHNDEQEIKIEVNSEEGRRHRLIINADDFGISQPRNKGILQLIKQNRVTSVSVLVTGVNGDSVNVASKELKSYILGTRSNDDGEKEEKRQRLINRNNKRTHSQMMDKVSVGLHFNLTEGLCLSSGIDCDLINPNNKSFKGKMFIYEYMQKLKQTNSPFPLAVKELIRSQLRLQIEKFIELFGFRPSHIDGHNHVHVIPEVAEIIGPIMQQYGVYKTRVPEEELKQLTPKSEMFVNNARGAKPIFDRFKIIYPSNFIGCEQINKLDISSIKQSVMKLSSKSQQNNNIFMQLMCHPGYSDGGNGDEFNQSVNRQVELASLKSQQFRESFLQPSSRVIQLSNYHHLQPIVNSQHRRRVLLYSKMNSGCGNWTTSLRLQQIFQSLGYEVYLRSIEENVNTNYQIQSLRQFLVQFQISLVIGVNLTRSGRVIYHATRSQDEITNKVPYFFIVAGTDANIYFNKPEAALVLKQPIQGCQLLVSLSESMVGLTQSFLVDKLGMKNRQKEIILLSQSSNLLAYEPKDAVSKHNVHKCLSANYNLDVQKDQYIVFPASFRPVKDIQFLLRVFNQLIEQEQNLRVLILGPILDQVYYQKCMSQMGRVQYLGSLQKELYIQVLKHAMFLVNTSISEGQSCSIQEAQECGQLCVVRNNQGNVELVKHLQTGFVFSTPEEFVSIYRLIKKNDNNLVQRLKSNGLQFHRNHFSIDAQTHNYKRIFDKILPKEGKLLTYKDVHALSDINSKLYQSVPTTILNGWLESHTSSRRLIDVGCGSGIFSLTVLKKFSSQGQSKINLQLYDYNASVISNCYYNCVQQLSGRLANVKSIELKVSDMFQKVDRCQQQPNLYVANMPQTPFRQQNSRPDKNGGLSSLKYNQRLIREFSTFHPQSVLIMLYSYMSNPRRFFGLLQELNLQISWRSERVHFEISSRQYDSMEEKLSELIKQHIMQGRAEVQIIQREGEELFIVPAEVLVIRRKSQ